MPRETWAGLLTLGDIQSYDSLVCHHPVCTSVRGDVSLMLIFFITVALSMLQDECVTEQKPTSTSVNNMENSHGNVVVNGLPPSMGIFLSAFVTRA